MLLIIENRSLAKIREIRLEEKAELELQYFDICKELQSLVR